MGAQSTFGVLLAIGGLVGVWFVATGRVQKLADGSVVLAPGAGRVNASGQVVLSKSTSTPAAAPASTNSGASDTTGLPIPLAAQLASSGPYIPLGVSSSSAGGVAIAGDPAGGAVLG